MKNRMMIVCIAAAFVIALGMMAPGQALAGVDINVSIPLFGLFAPGIYAGPPVVYAPAPPVYYAPQPVDGAVFYGGYWYRPSGGSWFISAQVGGPWTVIGVRSVPYPVISGPVMMHRAPYYSPWYGRGSYGRGNERHHHD
jgi:hypothetical protein